MLIKSRFDSLQAAATEINNNVVACAYGEFVFMQLCVANC